MNSEASGTPAPGTLTHPDRYYGAYIFDMDGTIYLGEELLPGVAELIHDLRANNIPVRFLSNNPTKDRSQYSDKLGRLGLATDPADIVNTIDTTVDWLLTQQAGKKVFAIAEEPLVRALIEAGIVLSDDPAEVDVVLASYDRSFDYRKLQIAFDALWFHRRAILVSSNPDRYCPMPGGRGEPDAAAIVAAIEACTGVGCVANFGKPNPQIAQFALKGLNVPFKDCLMVGDRLHTDIALAHNTGMASALVLTGDSTLEEALELPSSHQPNFIVERIDKLIPQN